MSKSVQTIDKRIIIVPKIFKFSIIGDPGCDGLGCEIISTFSDALKASTGEFIFILGDIVPYGSRNFYENIVELIENIVYRPVYMLCGNHDTHYYENYFGLKEYALIDDQTAIIVLDNSTRQFSSDSLDLVSHVLKDYPRKNILVFMHIPPPNNHTKNSVSNDEWLRITSIFTEYNLQSSLKYVVCGHLHSYFEEKINGTTLIVSGGGGARIEGVDGVNPPYYHIVEFSIDSKGTIAHTKMDLHFVKSTYSDAGITERLENAFKNECMAHIKYRLYAEDCRKRGLNNLSDLFYAASDSEFYHARNHYYALAELKEPQDALKEAITNENYEITEMYAEYLDYARQKDFGVPVYAFTDSLEAEKIHHRLFNKALESVIKGNDAPKHTYFTCSSCGYTFATAEHPKSCPVCGAPSDKILSVRSI